MKRTLGFVIIIAALLSGCSTAMPTTPVTASTQVVMLAATETAAPTATQPPTATATSTPTATPTVTASPTSTPTPTETATPTSTSTPRHTATPRPTKVPVTATATATATPASSAVVPLADVFSFDAGGFMKYLDYAHLKYQMATALVGGATHQSGNCRQANQLYNEMLAIALFTGAPEPWQTMVEEYNTLRTQAFITYDPVHKVCQAGGGTIDEETGRRMIDFFDRAQNRMYEMLQQAKAMTQ